MNQLSDISVLDIGPCRTNQTSAEAFQSMITLAQQAEEWGYKRYWMAEHHNIPATVASNIPVLAGIIAAKTTSIRLGGCLLLPNYPPYLISEQAAILEACYPGRIDLSIGSASGSDWITTNILRGCRRNSEDFTTSVQNLIALLNPKGSSVTFEDNNLPYIIKATPRALKKPSIWSWGTSTEDAYMAAKLGIPFMLCYHITGNDIQRAIKIYRQNFIPNDQCPEPKVLASVIVVSADTKEEAERLAKPQLMQMCSFRAGDIKDAQLLVEEAENIAFPEQYRSMESILRKTWIIDNPEMAAEKVKKLAKQLDINEIMINPYAAAYKDDATGRSANREYILKKMSDYLI